MPQTVQRGSFPDARGFQPRPGVFHGLPLIQWSAISGDMSEYRNDVNGVARRVINTARNGGVTLMHDLNAKCNKYTAIILPELEKRGYLCVTVDELFDIFGVTLEPNQVYYSCVDIAAGQP